MPALILDCDGVLADTERDGHRVAFNRAFEEFGVPLHWSEEAYADLVRIGGGKERLASVVGVDTARAAGLPADTDGVADLVGRLHRRKTELYVSLIVDGAIAPREGVARLVDEAADAGWSLAVASTSAEPSVRAVLRRAVGSARAQDFSVFAGDSVPRKKPAPDIYLAALGALGADPADAVAVEDSGNGLRAALAAGIRTVVTTSTYTAAEDFRGATAVLSSLGEPEHAAHVIADPHGVIRAGRVDLATLESIIRITQEVPA